MIPGLCSLVYRSSGGTSGGMTAIASPPSLSGGSGQTVVGNSTAMASGGTAPFTYAWAILYGDQSVTATSPTLATTAFDCGSLLPGSSTTAVFACTITDNIGSVAITNAVNIDFHLES